MKIEICIFGIFFVATQVLGATPPKTITLAWDANPPAENVVEYCAGAYQSDRDAVLDQNRISQVCTAQTTAVFDLDPNNVFQTFAVYARNAEGLRSDMSERVCYMFGDLTSDQTTPCDQQRVDGQDVSVFAGTCFGNATTDIADGWLAYNADLYPDGDINGMDFSLLVSVFGARSSDYTDLGWAGKRAYRISSSLSMPAANDVRSLFRDLFQTSTYEVSVQGVSGVEVGDTVDVYVFARGMDIQSVFSQLTYPPDKLRLVGGRTGGLFSGAPSAQIYLAERAPGFVDAFAADMSGSLVSGENAAMVLSFQALAPGRAVIAPSPQATGMSVRQLGKTTLLPTSSGIAEVEISGDGSSAPAPNSTGSSGGGGGCFISTLH